MDQTITWPNNTVQLDGQVTDDGLPYGSVYTEWTLEGGPETAVISDINKLKPTVRFNEPGVYEFILYADDGDRGSGSMMIVSVLPPGATIYSVSAEQLPNAATNLLDGNTDDSSRWSAYGFPQTVIIDMGCEVPFSEIALSTYKDRAYQYTIAVSDSADSGYVQIIDRSANQDNAQPITDAVSLISARYFKITVDGAADSYTGSWTSLTEVEIAE